MDLSTFFMLGFGTVVGIAIAVVAIGAMNKDKKVRTKYDERQKIARGKSYTWGFYAAIATAAIFTFLSTLDLMKFFGNYAYFTIIIAGVTVQAAHAILHDAYVGLNTNLKSYMIFMAIIGLINGTSAVSGIISGAMLEDGVLQMPFMNLLCAVMFVMLAVAMGVKHLIDKKEK